MDSIRNLFKKKVPRASIDNSRHLMTEGTYYDTRPNAQLGEAYGFRFKPTRSYTEVWDGEKNWGQLGFPLHYRADFRNLRIRSWQSYYESDITQIIINNYLMWAVGKGLTLQSEPVERLIKKFEPGFDRSEFVDDVETFWKMYADSEHASYSKMQDLHQVAWDAKLNAIVGGDVLCIQRSDGENVSVELIDGIHVSDPNDSKYTLAAKSRGNEIKHGVETDKTGKHIAFYIRTDDGKFERVMARHSKTGRRMSWLIYGTKYRLDDVRGMPLFSAVLEEMKKLNRYKEATISSAEERAKVVMAIEHGQTSTEENPMRELIDRSGRSGINDDQVPETQRFNGDDAAQKIAMTVPNSVINMPKDSKLTTVSSDNEINFKDFFSVNFDLICATLGIPPEVALGKYNSNYSASRMAVKTWEHKIEVVRNNFVKQFYKPVFTFWLDLRIMKGEIMANGYITARMRRNKNLVYAYVNCNFHGVNMPHVDPLKEVLAERKKLGDDMISLTTRTKATRNLNEGDWEQNIDNFKKENDRVRDLLDEMAQNQNQNQANNGKS